LKGLHGVTVEELLSGIERYDLEKLKGLLKEWL